VTFALSFLLTASLCGCIALTVLVVSRKRHRDRGEARFADRRAQIRTALITGDRGALEARLKEATKDLDAQVDLATTVDAIWPELDRNAIARLHEAVAATGIDAALSRSLGARSPAVKGRAVLLLSRLRLPGSTPLIAPLLRDRDADVRLTAAGALGTIGDMGSARALIGALAAEALPAERILERLGAPWAVDALLESLAAQERISQRRRAHGRSMRAHLALALGLARDPRAERALLILLSSGDTEERVGAARALGTAGTSRAFPELERALSDAEWTVRAQAAKSLGTLGATGAIPALEAGLSDTAWWVRSNCATALRKLGEPGLEALRRALESGDRYARDRAREALDYAAVATGGAR
jgi:HEAT repeat protein